MTPHPAQATPPEDPARRHERRYAAVTLTLAAAAVGAGFALHGAGALRVETALPSPGRLALELTTFVLAFDLYFYALHRLMHTRWLYRVHAVHHVSRKPRPLTALSFHPVEAGLLLLYPLLAMAVFPIHLASVCLGGTMLAISIALAHWGHEIFPAWWRRSAVLRWLATPSVHEAHHRRFDCNFGATTSIPDRLFGTYRDETTGVAPVTR